MTVQATLVAALAVEYWKLARSFERTLDHVPAEHLSKTEAQLRYSMGRLATLLSEAGLRLVTFEGASFEANLPASAVNGDEFADAGTALRVERTIEPAVVDDRKMETLRMGRVWIAEDGGRASRD